MIPPQNHSTLQGTDLYACSLSKESIFAGLTSSHLLPEEAGHVLEANLLCSLTSLDGPILSLCGDASVRGKTTFKSVLSLNLLVKTANRLTKTCT